jgi:hypothetical protein
MELMPSAELLLLLFLLYRLCVGGGVLISGLQNFLMQLLLHRMEEQRWKSSCSMRWRMCGGGGGGGVMMMSRL